MQNQLPERVAMDIAMHWIEHLPPASFSLVMATGIVSIASEFLGLHWIAMPLFLINSLFFGVLWVMTAARLLVYPAAVLSDFRAHAKGPGFFTIVAGTCVLGVQIVLLTEHAGFAAGLWLFALCLWCLITYAFFTLVIAQSVKPSLGDGLNGIWLIASVATQSIAVLGTIVAYRFPDHQQTILFVCLLFYFMGCMLYLNIIALLFYRLKFFPIEPTCVTPPYWINMGATAIATQAGASLLLHAGESPLLLALKPFVIGFTLFFWAAGTWWIPLLIALGIWAHWLKRVPIVYTPMFWGAVFPVGMYTASTYQLAMASDLHGLLWLPAITIYIALSAWALTFLGFLRHLLREWNRWREARLSSYQT